MMDKATDAFRTISEVAEELDLPQHVLRFWETRFAHIKPLKRGGGRRYYRPDDVDLLRGIRYLLYGQGYTIKGVQRIIKDHGAKAVMSVWQDPGGNEESAGNQLSSPASSDLSLHDALHPKEFDEETAPPSGPGDSDPVGTREPGSTYQPRDYTPRADVSIMRGGLSGLGPATPPAGPGVKRSFRPMTRANLNMSGSGMSPSPSAAGALVAGKGFELTAAELGELMNALQDLAECRRILEAAGRS